MNELPKDEEIIKVRLLFKNYLRNMITVQSIIQNEIFDD